MSKLWVIAYDIEDDASRRRVYKILENVGNRVQYSVFECWLNDAMLVELTQQVTNEIEKHDSVRWYPLCSWCSNDVSWVGTGKPADDPEYYLL